MSSSSLERPFEYRDHTADVLILSYGRTLEEAFINAAYALSNFMYDVLKVEPKLEVEIEVRGFDLEQLLFNWIDEILYRLDAERFALSRIDDLKVLKVNDEYVLRAKVVGERYDVRKHGFKGTIVKAMTYHMMRIEKVNDVWRVQYVVDI